MKPNTLPVTTDPDLDDWGHTREEAFIRDVERAAVHECGHLVAGHHFGQVAKLKVWLPEDDPPRDWRTSNQVRGVCQCKLHGSKSRNSPFISACIGWAGVVAESISDHRYEIDLVEFEGVYSDLLDLVFFDPTMPYVSETDMALIVGHHQRWRAAAKAFGIIMANRQALEQAVEKVRHDLVVLRKSVTWIHPEDIGLKPHVRFIQKHEVAA